MDADFSGTDRLCQTYICTYTGVWTHITWSMTRSSPTASSGSSQVYVNSVLTKDVASIQYPVKATTINYIGKSHWSDNQLFVGSMDSLAIYPWVLGPADAVYLFGSTGIMVWVCILFSYVSCCVLCLMCVAFWCVFAKSFFTEPSACMRTNSCIIHWFACSKAFSRGTIYIHENICMHRHTHIDITYSCCHAPSAERLPLHLRLHAHAKTHTRIRDCMSSRCSTAPFTSVRTCK